MRMRRRFVNGGLAERRRKDGRAIAVPFGSKDLPGPGSMVSRLRKRLICGEVRSDRSIWHQRASPVKNQEVEPSDLASSRPIIISFDSRWQSVPGHRCVWKPSCGGKVVVRDLALINVGDGQEDLGQPAEPIWVAVNRDILHSLIANNLGRAEHNISFWAGGEGETISNQGS